MRHLVLSRAFSVMAPVLLMAGSLAAFATTYHGELRGVNSVFEWVLFFGLPFVFSAGFVWFLSELLYPAVTRGISSPVAARSSAMILAVGIHVMIGVSCWLAFSGIPSGISTGERALVWVPFWITGVFFGIGHIDFFHPE